MRVVLTSISPHHDPWHFLWRFCSSATQSFFRTSPSPVSFDALTGACANLHFLAPFCHLRLGFELFNLSHCCTGDQFPRLQAIDSRSRPMPTSETGVQGVASFFSCDFPSISSKATCSFSSRVLSAHISLATCAGRFISARERTDLGASLTLWVLGLTRYAVFIQPVDATAVILPGFVICGRVLVYP